MGKTNKVLAALTFVYVLLTPTLAQAQEQDTLAFVVMYDTSTSMHMPILPEKARNKLKVPREQQPIQLLNAYEHLVTQEVCFKQHTVYVVYWGPKTTVVKTFSVANLWDIERVAIPNLHNLPDPAFNGGGTITEDMEASVQHIARSFTKTTVLVTTDDNGAVSPPTDPSITWYGAAVEDLHKRSEDSVRKVPLSAIYLRQRASEYRILPRSMQGLSDFIQDIILDKFTTECLTN